VSLQARVEALEERVAALEGERPGRKVLPILVSEPGVCGVDPERRSKNCPDASLYRRRKGCLGTACQQKATEYYEQYRANHTAVAPPKRRR
jgi:hypothetical protein